MSHLTNDDVLKLRQLIRRKDEEAGAGAQQAGLAAMMALSAEASQPAPEAGRSPSRIVVPEQVRRRAAARDPAWLYEDPALALTGDFPVVPASDPSAVGRHRPLARRAAADSKMAVLAMDLYRLSGGSVRRIARGGPVLARHPEHRRLRRSTFDPALSTPVRLLIAFLSLCWLGCLIDFWVWWLAPAHWTTMLGLAVNSYVLVYLTCYPVFYILSANRLHNVSRSVAVPLLRVAFAVTRAPSEPFHVAEATLTAMLTQDFPLPYDVWLCDEAPTAEITNWCDEHGVIVSSRNGREKYHRLSWPRRTKCKEGNLAYFYDHWGYRNYDVVAQLDCDHKPSPSYLSEIVRPFSDPAVGYVAAPSICDTNAAQSWAARGRLHREASFHGALQLGHSDGWAPSCIGSHYAVRTRALREIGGIGPELAEDFSTGFLLSAAGWQGAFAIDAEAHGDGPNTFAAMLTQEFQWARSITVVLLGLVPRNMLRLPWRLRLRFFYHLCFYTLLITSTLGGFVLASTAAVTGKPWINVNYLAFMAHWWSLSLWVLLITVLLRRKGLLRPYNAPMLSWENWLYTLTRWPYNAWGICSAILDRVTGRNTTFRVTPKGTGGLEPLRIRLTIPYVVVSAACADSALYGEGHNNAVGYVFICMAAAFMYALACILIPVLHATETAAQAHVRVWTALLRTSIVPLLIGIITMVPVIIAVIHYPAYAINTVRFWRPLI